jgi:hypothetical protein
MWKYEIRPTITDDNFLTYSVYRVRTVGATRLLCGSFNTIEQAKNAVKHLQKPIIKIPE